MTRKHTECIEEYYDEMDKVSIVGGSPFTALSVLFAGRNSVLVSDNLVLRGIGKLKGMERAPVASTAKKAVQYFALLDAFSLLRQKEIPIYFYNRIGKKKKDFVYRDREQKRMKAGLSFPVMYQDIDKYEEDLQDIFGILYSKKYVEEIGKIPQVIKVADRYQHEDYHSPVINVENGKRVTTGQPLRFASTIHVYGRCGAFGYAVEDKDTLPSQLQKELAERGIKDIRVVNHGLWGGTDEYLDHNFLQDAVGMKKGDIVLFYRKHFNKKLLEQFIKRGVVYRDITEEWHAQREENVTFFNRPGHMNGAGYQLVARLIAEELVNTGFQCGSADPELIKTDAKHLTQYIKSTASDEFENEIKDYISAINAQYPLTDATKANGAIVMNCNPFTKGHRYLIETAAKQVGRLYIFVVEEDRSLFSFEHRLEMVKKGTQDIENVVVVPSGKFIISAYTFPEYFMKDYVKEKNFDVSMDVETFCKYIAPALNIKVRFAGEEPFDPVTKNYNENMARILPEHNMRFAEIPRLALDPARIINATKVRELLKNREYEQLKEYVPKSTYEILMEKYST